MAQPLLMACLYRIKGADSYETSRFDLIFSLCNLWLCNQVKSIKSKKVDLSTHSIKYNCFCSLLIFQYLSGQRHTDPVTSRVIGNYDIWNSGKKILFLLKVLYAVLSVAALGF